MALAIALTVYLLVQLRMTILGFTTSRATTTEVIFWSLTEISLIAWIWFPHVRRFL